MASFRRALAPQPVVVADVEERGVRVVALLRLLQAAGALPVVPAPVAVSTIPSRAWPSVRVALSQAVPDRR